MGSFHQLGIVADWPATAIVRSPLMERHRIFGTAAHIDFAKSYLRKMLLHDG
jgi:hypothetical protein